MMFYDLFSIIYVSFYDIFSHLGFSEFMFFYELPLNCVNDNYFKNIIYQCNGDVASYLALICCLVVIVLLFLFIIKLFKMIFNRFACN